MELFDTHCHLDVAEFADDALTLLARARAQGVRRLVLPGVDRHGWSAMLAMARDDQQLLVAPGLHPLYLARHRPGDIQALEEIVSREQVVAVGEIGLDYYHPGSDQAAQQQLFEAQLAIATSRKLPVLLHVRRAHDQVLATLRRRHFQGGGIVHAFNGSLQQAQAYIRLGFMIALGGTITWERSRRIRAVAAELPAKVLVLETDAPDIPIASQHGQRNLPEHLLDICLAVAELRHETPEQVAAYTTANAERVLRLPKAGST